MGIVAHVSEACKFALHVLYHAVVDEREAKGDESCT